MQSIGFVGLKTRKFKHNKFHPSKNQYAVIMLAGIQNENPREKVVLFCYKLSSVFLIFTVTFSWFLVIFSTVTSLAKGFDYFVREACFEIYLAISTHIDMEV